MKRLKRVLGSVKNLTKDEFGGSTSSVLSRLTTTKSVASKSSLDSRNEFHNKDGAYMGYDFQSSPLHGSHLIDYTDPLNYSDQASTKLHKYCFLGDVGKVKKSLKKVNINSQDSEGRTPLHLAAASGHLEVVLILLVEKVNLQIDDYDGRSPFLIAVERNQIGIVQILLKNKVDKLAKDKYGNQAIHVAARTGAKDVIDLLIDAGLDPNAVNMLDQTPLHIATENLNIDVVKSLLNCQLNVNAVDKESVSALMIAAKTGSNPLVDHLLVAGADIQLTDSSGWNAIAYAKYSMHEELEQKLSLLLSSDHPGGSRPGEQTQSLDRVPKRHVRSISDTYDSWTNSSISESQRLKLTYFNADAEHSSSSKTLPRQRHSSSSIGPPKPPRLYTSTPNLDMNEQNIEEHITSKEQRVGQHRSSKHSMDNQESSWDNTIKSDISFQNDDNSLMDFSQCTMEEESISDIKNIVVGGKVIANAHRSHSLSPDNWDSDTDISESRKTRGEIRSESKPDHVSYNDEQSAGSNKDNCNEIEEVWESNAHLSVDSPDHSQWSNSIKHEGTANKDSDFVEQPNVNIREDFFDNNLNSAFDHSISISPRNIYKSSIHESTLSSHNSTDSAKMSEHKRSEESNLSLLLSATTPSGREELQGLVRKLRGALNEVNVNSKAKDYSLTTLKKSESFLKKQLKEIEQKTSELTEQNIDFMHRLEHLQSRTSTLKDEANSVCDSLEEKRLILSDDKSTKRKTGKKVNIINESVRNKETDKNLPEYTSVSNGFTTNIRNESYDGYGPMANVNQLQLGHTPVTNQAASKLIETTETAVQADLKQSILHAVETQTETCANSNRDTLSGGIGSNPGEINYIRRNENCCSEETLAKMFNSAMEEWKIVFQDACTRVTKSVDDYSSRDQVINEVNNRLDYLNEQVPSYRDDVKAAVESSVFFNEDVIKAMKKIEDSCNSVAELKTLPDILKTRDSKVDSALSNIAQMKQELSESLDRLEASINSNYSSAQHISRTKSDESVMEQIQSIYGKIASIESNMDLMQCTLTEKIITFSNVSDEIKEVSCGMRRISDNYGAINKAARNNSTNDSGLQDLALGARFGKLENNFDGFGASLEMLRRDLSTKLESFSGLANDSGKSLCLLDEIFNHFSVLDIKMHAILQNQDSPKNPPQLEDLKEMLTSHETSIQDIKLTVQFVYDLLKSFERQQLTNSSDAVVRGRTGCHENDPENKSSSIFSVGLEEINKNTPNENNEVNPTEIETKSSNIGMRIDILATENRQLVAENQLLQSNLDKSQADSISQLTQSQYNEWVAEKAMIQEEAKCIRKVNRELFGKLSSLETDCDELEEELELQNKEMQNQKKINSIQKKEIMEMRQQMAIVVCLQNEKFSLVEQVTRFEHTELEYKHIIDQLQKRILELSRGNASSSDGCLMGGNSDILEAEDARTREGSNGFSCAQNGTKDVAIDSLVANIDNHFQSIVGKKLKELSEMLVERVMPDSPAKEPNSVAIYQREMIKLQKEIISLRDEIERVDCDKELWNSRYDKLHARYEDLQRQQPFSRRPADDEASFEKVLETIDDQLKIPYPVSRIVESGHPDSDYFSSLRCSTASGPTSLEPRSAERTFVSVLRPCRSSPPNEQGHTLIPLYVSSRPENKSSVNVYNTTVTSASSVEQSSERYIDFLEVKHSV